MIFRNNTTADCDCYIIGKICTWEDDDFRNVAYNAVEILNSGMTDEDWEEAHRYLQGDIFPCDKGQND